MLRTAPDDAPAAAGAVAAGTLKLLALPALAVAAVVAGALLLGLACDVVRLRRVKRQAVPFGSVAVRGARIGLSRTVTTPTAIGYLHPAVILPDGFRARVDDREWDAVVAHECAHLARGDDWAKAVQSAILRAGWWIPGLWVLSRALDLERELASDERAAAETGARRYAACLLRLATDRADAVAPALWARRSHVAIRVERLVRPTSQAAPVVRAAALGAFTAAALGVDRDGRARCPGHRAGRRRRAAARARRRRAPRDAARPAARRRTSPPPEARAAYAYAGLHAPSAPPRRSRRVRSVQRIIATVARRTVSRALADVPSRALRGRRTSSIRPEFGPTETLAFVAPHRKCRTCFGPLRSPDDVPEQTFTAGKTVASTGSGAAAAVAADDPASGPVDLGSGLIWYRLPARVQGP